jgi:predicted PurR-regulated permease PerM
MDNNIKTISITTGTMFRFLLILLFILIFWVLRNLLLVLLTSIVIASFVESAVPFLKKIKLGRVWGVVVLYVFSILILSGLFYLFAPLLITEIYNFATFVSDYFPDVTFFVYFQNEAFSGAKDVLVNLTDKMSITTLLSASKAFVENLSTGFIQTLSVAFGSIFNVVLITIISFYLSIQEKGIENFLRIILPIKQEEYAIDLWNRSRHKIALWMRGQLFLGLIVGVLIYLALILIGVKYALLLAIVAGILTLVPYGMVLAVVPAMSISFMAGGYSEALIVGAVYFVINQFESYFLTPFVINNVVGLSPLVVILSVLVGFELGGFWGMVLSIPVAVVLMELMNDLEKKKIFQRNENKQ